MINAVRNLMARPNQNTATLIVGLGKTGLSVARFLHRQGEAVTVIDSRATPPALAELRRELPDIEVHVDGFDPAVFARAQRLIVSPGISVQEPVIAAAQQRGAEIIGDIELFARRADAPVIAITGSNGKSTVTTMVGAMLARAGLPVQVGGNLGRPALDLLQDTPPAAYVLELSSFQLETTHSLNARAAVVLNVSPDHMDRYATLAEYADAKHRIYRGDGVMVLNADDSAVVAMQEMGRKVIPFTLREPPVNAYGLIEAQDRLWLARGDERLIAADELRITGRHNFANALAALALGEAMNIDHAARLAALREFAGLSHRTQWVRERDGVQWYNDSKGTNIGATLAAIEGMDGPMILIAGGQGKGADFTALRGAVADKVRAVILFGEDAPQLAEALDGVTQIYRSSDMEDAVHQAARLAQAGDTVLLSPACASFDMFDNYEHRGEVFMEAVRRLAP
jgi:UDP-N-acetylmuramoylalanine--D-glutamate ligase